MSMDQTSFLCTAGQLCEVRVVGAIDPRNGRQMKGKPDAEARDPSKDVVCMLSVEECSDGLRIVQGLLYVVLLCFLIN